MFDSSTAKPDNPTMDFWYWSRFRMRVIGRCDVDYLIVEQVIPNRNQWWLTSINSWKRTSIFVVVVVCFLHLLKDAIQTNIHLAIILNKKKVPCKLIDLLFYSSSTECGQLTYPEFPKRLTITKCPYILPPVTDNCSTWVSGRERIAIEISRPGSAN